MASTISTEQKPRSELVHRGRDHRRLRRNACPTIIPQDASAEARNGQRAFRAPYKSQAIRNILQRTIGGVAQLVSDESGSLECFVHHDATVNDEPNAPRRGTSIERGLGLRGERMNGGVNARGLACRSGQIERLGPGASRNALCEYGLPRKRIMRCPKRLKELGEARTVGHDSGPPPMLRGRQSP